MKVDALLNGLGCLLLSVGLTLALYLALLSSSPEDEYSSSSDDPSSTMDEKTALFLFVVLVIGFCVPCCFIAGLFMTYSAIFDSSLARRLVAKWTCAFVADSITTEKDLVNGGEAKRV